MPQRNTDSKSEGRQARTAIVKIGTKRLTTDLLVGLGLRAFGALSSFALAWLIAQLFGARVVGLYQVGYTTATLLATVAVLSMDVVLVRKVTPLIASERLDEASAAFRSTRAFVAKFGIGLALALAIMAFPFATYLMQEPELGPYLALLAPAVLLLPLMRVQNALIRSLGRVVTSQWLEGVLYVTVAIAGLAVLALIFPNPEPLAAPAFLIVGLLCSVAIGFSVTSRYLRSWPEPEASAGVEVRSGAAIAAGPIIGQAGNWLVLIAITAIMSAADAGIFRMAVLTCMLMQLVNTSFATMAGPYLSRAADAGNLGQIRKVILFAGSIGVAIASPVGLVALLAPEWVLGLFGDEFRSGALALQLIAIGQLINVLAGPVGIALIMQGREQWVLRVEALATLSGLGIAIALLPSWDIAGAGLGLLVADVIRNGTNWFLVWFHRPTKDTTPG